ncbi:MAG: hypothetical protein ACI88H_003785 [Cocleimonas sp.]|jgi:hypothetical protein
MKSSQDSMVSTLSFFSPMTIHNAQEDRIDNQIFISKKTHLDLKNR